MKIELEQDVIEDQKMFFGSGGKSMLSSDRYFDSLRNSNFTFCLPVTYWTPRTFESIACCSMPIMEEDYMHSYDIPFEDGINCVIIKNCKNTKNWSTTLKKILTFSEHQILSMRKNIHDIRKTHLLPEKYLERQRIRYGL